VLPANAAQLTVGFSQIGSESGWRAAETTVSKSEAGKRSVNLKIADAQQKQENQIKAIRSFVAQGVDAIFLAPVVSSGWDAVLKEAKQAKIPVILLDRDIDPSGKDLYLTAVTSDSVHEGEVAATGLPRRSATSRATSSSCRARSGRALRPTARRVSTWQSPNMQTSRSCAARPAISPAPRARK
jgi:ABC-type xylose transport system substrate-binding protein